MNWLSRVKTKQVKKEELLDPTTISVEGIQGILVKEFDLNSALKEELANLKVELEETKRIGNEFKLKYEATLLVADERSKRLEKSNRNVQSNDHRIQVLENAISTLKKEIDSYYFKCREYEQERETFRSTIQKQYEDKYHEEIMYTLHTTKEDIVSVLNAQDGRVSKTKCIEIVNTCFNEIIDSKIGDFAPPTNTNINARKKKTIEKGK